MIEKLNTQLVADKFATSPPYTPTGFTIPDPTVKILKPLSYDFRVAEYVNDADEVVKVGLQVCISEHDVYGVRNVIQGWTDVERVKIKLP
jgi:hypothetical protein